MLPLTSLAFERLKNFREIASHSGTSISQTNSLQLASTQHKRPALLVLDSFSKTTLIIPVDRVLRLAFMLRHKTKGSFVFN